MTEWRAFVARLRKSDPFSQLWDESCQQILGEHVILQPDTPTRWSSSVTMLMKAVKVKGAVERMFNVTLNMPDHHVFFC